MEINNKKMTTVIPFFKYHQIRHCFLEIVIECYQCFQKVIRENINATSEIEVRANISASIARTHGQSCYCNY